MVTGAQGIISISDIYDYISHSEVLSGNSVIFDFNDTTNFMNKALSKFGFDANNYSTSAIGGWNIRTITDVGSFFGAIGDFFASLGGSIATAVLYIGDLFQGVGYLITAQVMATKDLFMSALRVVQFVWDFLQFLTTANFPTLVSPYIITN